MSVSDPHFTLLDSCQGQLPELLRTSVYYNTEDELNRLGPGVVELTATAWRQLSHHVPNGISA